MVDEKIVALKLPYPNGGEKTVRVFVPAHDEGETFPAVYMTDGQNLFDEETSTYCNWHTMEAVRAERAESGRAAVIVGIHNDGSPKERANDLTPKTIGKIQAPLPVRLMMRPQAEVFDEFVINTVIPTVEEQFPVKTGRENRGFCGSSSGGIMSFFTAMSHPDIFAAAGVFSCVFMMYRENELKNWIHDRMRPNMPLLYIYSGGADKLEKKILKGTQAAQKILSEVYPAKKLSVVTRPDQKHHETAWEPEFRSFLHIFLSL